MDISMTAKLKNKNAFFELYQDGDEKKLYDGGSLLNYAITNHDLETRYVVSNFLLDKGTDATILNSDHVSSLHALLAQLNHDLPKTIDLCRRLIENGADINVITKSKKVSALQEIINMGYSDDELEPLYDLWFSQPYVDCTTKNFRGYSPMDLAGKIPNRAKLYERMKRYVETIR